MPVSQNFSHKNSAELNVGSAHVQYVCRVSELGQNLGYALPG